MSAGNIVEIKGAISFRRNVSKDGADVTSSGTHTDPFNGPFRDYPGEPVPER